MRLRGIILLIVLVIGIYSCTHLINNEISGNGEWTQINTAPEAEEWTPTKVVVNYHFSENKCTTCHGGLEHIRAEESGMMQQILEIADKSGNPGNDCIVCHGGNPNTTQHKKAHLGTAEYFKKNEGPKNFYPEPGSPWINQHTCGMCHSEQVKTQFTSLMFTEAGKIQGTLWGFGGMNGYDHDIGNYEVEEVAVHERLGTDIYKDYMGVLAEKEPQLFPSKMSSLPEAPTAEEVMENPQLAVYTYLRQECQRCHTGNKGRQKRGDYRGMGCSSCHIPYGNEGIYEGGDSSITGKGKLLVHAIQGTREAKVTVHQKHYSGVPVETCTTCHDRGKRIGTSYQGLMETAYSSPFMGDGDEQPKLHSKNYLHLKSDVHLRKGMLCQDCHTSLDVHSDGSLAGATLAPVEIECQDCHGTPTSYPWELPIGYGDEVAGLPVRSKTPRGVTKKLAEYLKQGTEYNPRDGYLISARGNPIPNVVKSGDTIILHSATGKDLSIKPLKYLYDNNQLSLEAEVAMVTVSKHTEELECYTCHATWAPQCYGCHVKVDYSKDCSKKPDWVAMGQAHDSNGLTADARGELEDYLIDGEITESRSFLRWENPPLVRNGENRISPAIPGCQTTITVIGTDGKPLLENEIFKIPNVEGAGEEGQLGIDISPVQPHTIQAESRACESCHTNPQSMGYGIEGGTIYEDPSKDFNVDIGSGVGSPLAQNTQTQINAIPNLKMDWSRFVTEDGKQLQTVGHHFKNSRPLNNQERQNLDRRGVCLSCHQSIPNGNMAIDLLHHIKEVSNPEMDTNEHNDLISKVLNIAGWVQFLLVIISLVVGFWMLRWAYKKRKNSRE
ncbi:MAG: hypothetical protein ACI9GM_001039 [Salibacteraceae bacterium]|jgi:hypothetical protein